MSSGGRPSHEFETRISAIADFVHESKGKKLLPVIHSADPRRDDPGYEERTVRRTANSLSTSSSVFHRCGVTRIACPRTET